MLSRVFILSADPKVVGFAMYYFTYDPWVGKQLYMEEFYVMKEYRGETSPHLRPHLPWGASSFLTWLSLLLCVQGWASGHTSCVTSAMYVTKQAVNTMVVIWVPGLQNSRLFQLAVKTRCTGMMFVVAENNEPSLQFYKRRGAEDLSEEEGWRLFRFNKGSLMKMATKPEEWRRRKCLRSRSTCSAIKDGTVSDTTVYLYSWLHLCFLQLCCFLPSLNHFCSLQPLIISVFVALVHLLCRKK